MPGGQLNSLEWIRVVVKSLTTAGLTFLTTGAKLVRPEVSRVIGRSSRVRLTGVARSSALGLCVKARAEAAKPMADKRAMVVSRFLRCSNMSFIKLNRCLFQFI